MRELNWKKRNISYIGKKERKIERKKERKKERRKEGKKGRKVER